MSNPPVISQQPTSGQPQGGLSNQQTQGMGQQYQYQTGRPMMMGVGPQYQMGMQGYGPQYQMGMQRYGPQNQMGVQGYGPQNQMGMQGYGPPHQMGMPGVPPGLEYLSLLTSLSVRQQIEVLEIISGIHQPNRYDIFNGHGELVFRAVEVPNTGGAILCGAARDFNILVYDLMGRQIMNFNRPTACCGEEALTVTGPSGTRLGTIDPQSICDPLFIVTNALGEPVLKMSGLGCGCCNCGTVDFNVYGLDGTSLVGRITKQWSGFVQEAYSAADSFTINFPVDLDVNIKATLLGACVLLDFMYFENVENQNHHHHHHHHF